MFGKGLTCNVCVCVCVCVRPVLADWSASSGWMDGVCGCVQDSTFTLTLHLSALALHSVEVDEGIPV